MKIGIEAQRIFRANKHGMDYVVLQEILQLQRIDKENEYYVFVKPGPDRCVSSTDNVHVVELSMPSYPLWEQVALPRAARRYDVDLLHCTSNTAPLLWRRPMVLTLHDIIFMEPRGSTNSSAYQNMGRLYRRFVVPHILGHCNRIITVSEFERQNIIRQAGVEPERMAMIYNACNDWFKPTTDPDGVYKKYVEEPGYLFFLGNTDPKKNTERTLIAYARYLEQSAVKRPLLMADLDRRYLDDIIRRNNIDHIRQHIKLPGYISNADLPYVYGSAFAFLYTSLRESFGIPLLEAMACGTPVVTSNTSSMPEVAGSEAILVDPSRPDDIARELLRLETDDNYRQQQSAYGLSRAAAFSWENTARQLLELYQEVVSDSCC
ncbi:MAG: glycosyltransferase family 4 protein [Prevotella sp.]|nr:glycosyltransferase family 4 protein [Prevotella sp.]